MEQSTERAPLVFKQAGSGRWGTKALPQDRSLLHEYCYLCRRFSIGSDTKNGIGMEQTWLYHQPNNTIDSFERTLLQPIGRNQALKGLSDVESPYTMLSTS